MNSFEAEAARGSTSRQKVPVHCTGSALFWGGTKLHCTYQFWSGCGAKRELLWWKVKVMKSVIWNTIQVLLLNWKTVWWTVTWTQTEGMLFNVPVLLHVWCRYHHGETNVTLVEYLFIPQCLISCCCNEGDDVVITWLCWSRTWLSPWLSLVVQIKEIIRQGIEVPEGQNDLRRQQLRELALLNGTLRENDGLAWVDNLQFWPSSAYSYLHSIRSEI